MLTNVDTTPTVNEIYDTFKHKASDFNINKTLPTKADMKDIRKKLEDNCLNIIGVSNMFQSRLTST